MLIGISHAQTFPSGSIYYQNITIGSWSGASSQYVQQNIILDESNYTSYINYNGSIANFEFTYANGTVIPSWIESNQSNQTLVWLNITNTTTNVYLDFFNMTTNMLNSTGTNGTGEAPQLSPTYAEYDNGANVFPSLYTNFAGTSAPSGWTASTSPPPDISNGLSLTTTCEYLYTNSNYGLNDAQILDFYGTYPAPTGGANTGLGYGTSVYWDINTNANVNYVVATVGSITAPPSTSVWGIYWPSTSSASFYNNYALLGTATGSLPTTALPIEGQMQCAAGQAITGPFYWLRIRAYPPSGVMPSVSFGGAE